MSQKICVIVLCFLLPLISFAQEEDKFKQLMQLPGRFYARVNSKAAKLDSQLANQTEKYLRRLAKREEKLRRKLSRIDSNAAKQLFSNSSAEYERLIGKVKTVDSGGGGFSGEYLPYTDSLKGILSFMQSNRLKLPANLQGEPVKALRQFERLQGRLKVAEEAREFVRRRKQQLREALGRYTKLAKGFTGGLNDFNKEVYYYSQQVREYKDMLNEPDKLTRKALSLLNKVPAFNNFMKQYSQLAGLFGVPAGYGNVASLAGLQTRAQVQAMIQGQLASAGSGGQQLLQQNLQAAQAQLDQLKDKLAKLGPGSADIDMPEFKLNGQRTKRFLQRLEIGTNLQSSKSNFFFPTTTDLGLSIGYKLSDKGTVGIGGSYKIGWGKDIRNIVLTSQGASVRSFLDLKLKGSVFASGGFEYNYQPVDVTGLQITNSWTKSGLVGISKIISLKSKFFKKTKCQLMWDFLSYDQQPKTQPLIFRINYSIK